MYRLSFDFEEQHKPCSHWASRNHTSCNLSNNVKENPTDILCLVLVIEKKTLKRIHTNLVL